MERLSAIVLSGMLFSSALFAQTCDLVVFSDMGDKFTLVVDGDEKNAAPASRVVATGLRNETPMIVVKWADPNVAPLKQSGWLPAGKEYTLVLTTNKKGERVIRPQGEAPLGTAKSGPAKAAPTNFVDDAVTPTSDAGPPTGGSQSTTNTTVTETSGSGTGENVNVNFGVNGMGLNMNMAVDDGVNGASTTSTTTTSTTTVTHSSTVNGRPVDTHEPTIVNEPGYTMPGYNGPVGCAYPMNDGEFNEAKGSIESKSFEESKMTMAKQIGRDRCFTVAQVKGIMGVFSFEDSKLDFAKFAYDHTYDKGNYYKVNDVFSFESSIDDLNHYIQGR